MKEILTYYIKHQEDVITRRTRFDLEKAEEREHILKGLAIALANIDEVIKVIKESADNDSAAKALMERFLLSDKQAAAILEMRLRRLTSLEVEKINDELAQKEVEIANYKEILADINKVNDIVKKELLEVKETYNTPRRSEVSYDYSEINIEDLIEKEDIVVSMTHGGYVKRQPVAEYKSQHRGGVGITAHKTKDEDFVESIFTTSTHDDLMFFTNFGKVYVIKGYEIPEASRNSRGRAVINILQLDPGEKVATLLPVPERGEGYLMLATKQGLIKKTALSEFESIRKTGKKAIRLVNAGMLYFYLHKRNIFRFGAHWKKLVLQFGIANAAMIAALWYGLTWYNGDVSAWMRVLEVTILCIVGVAAYAIALIATGFRPRHLKP